MQGQVGSWDEHLAVALGDEALRWLDGFGYDRRVVVDVEEVDGVRRVMVIPSPKGSPFYTHHDGNGVPDQVRASWHSIQPEAPWPRFELTDVVWTPVGRSLLTVELPADHLLPWPKLRPCASYDAGTVAAMELDRRLVSAAMHNPDVAPKDWNWVRPPATLKALIPAKRWMQSVRQATTFYSVV